ncbi:winged helix-turn-helix domain-containing protein [candidate division KSB1 bacterium]|nr:winged helix-turn-helix domain-containing protein [candidate division KSB1 bacterium]
MPELMSQASFQLHEWLVKPHANELVGQNQTLKLDHKVMQLLVYFAQNPDKDLSKEEILKAVWGEGVFSEEVLTVAVSSLRKSLGDDSRSPKYVKTIPRYGYRLLMSPAALPASAGDPTLRANRLSSKCWNSWKPASACAF